MPSILVVEDDLSVQHLLAATLELEGFTVTTANNGAEALVCMRQSRPCLVLLDLMMPVMDGEEFRAEQLHDPQLADVPVVCISAIYDAQARADRMRAVACVEKPFSLDHVVQLAKARCAADMGDGH
jgi:CheY-like chemotaxis protein